MTRPSYTPGTYGVVATNEGKGHKLTATLMSDAIRRGAEGWANHAYIVVPGGLVVEMEGGGAQIAPLSKYDGCRTAYNDEEAATLPVEVLTAVVDYSLNLVSVHKGGTRASDQSVGYNYPGIVAIGLARIGFPGAGGFVTRRFDRGDSLFCSQAVDCGYAAGHYELFTDHRAAGAVAPTDLEWRIAARSWQT